MAIPVQYDVRASKNAIDTVSLLLCSCIWTYLYCNCYWPLQKKVIPKSPEEIEREERRERREKERQERRERKRREREERQKQQQQEKETSESGRSLVYSWFTRTYLQYCCNELHKVVSIKNKDFTVVPSAI